MKKWVVLILLMVLCTGCFSKNEYIEIGLDDVEKKITSKETFSLFVGSKECVHCDSYKVKLNKVIKEYNLEVFYIDIAKLTEDEKDTLKKLVNYRGSTPTTTFFVDGEECINLKKIVGDKDEDYIIEKFKNNGYIKEDKNE